MSRPIGLSDEEWRKKAVEQQRRYYKANRERLVEKQRRYREANPEKKAAQQRRHRAANPEKWRELRRRYRESLTDSYVAATLGMPLADCPRELLEMKREQLMLLRIVKQLQKEIEHG